MSLVLQKLSKIDSVVNDFCHAGNDNVLVPEASRAGLQVHQGLHDGNGILGWSRDEKHAVSCPKGMFYLL